MSIRYEASKPQQFESSGFRSVRTRFRALISRLAGVELAARRVHRRRPVSNVTSAAPAPRTGFDDHTDQHPRSRFPPSIRQLDLAESLRTFRARIDSITWSIGVNGTKERAPESDEAIFICGRLT